MAFAQGTFSTNMGIRGCYLFVCLRVDSATVRQRQPNQLFCIQDETSVVFSFVSIQKYSGLQRPTEARFGLAEIASTQPPYFFYNVGVWRMTSISLKSKCCIDSTRHVISLSQSIVPWSLHCFHLPYNACTDRLILAFHHPT